MAHRQSAVESLEMNGPFNDCYRSCRVAVTGHTGFKGSWLALWLKEMGAEVIGIALPPNTTPNHWDLLKLDIEEHCIDIRDATVLNDVIAKAKPEIVFHLAAQSLVRRSYREPVDTWATNVMGTVNLLEACKQTPSIKAMVIATTDKCYENKESAKGYRETDRLGGHDPYSASKAGAELAVASYRDAFFANGPLVATARAGNVIGGGDWSEDRLIPDLARATAKREALIVRAPGSVRPWQYVLEPLSGYLQLGEQLLAGNRDAASAWNFGPDANAEATVAKLLDTLKKDWPELDWKTTNKPQPHETVQLRLDSCKARQQLKWKPVLPYTQQLSLTAEWYRAFAKQNAPITRAQLAAYLTAAKAAGSVWAT